MILDTIENSDACTVMNPDFQAAFAFLRDPHTARLPPGRHPIDGERVYAVVIQGALKARDAARMEVHRKYLDIQCVFAGQEDMGWLPRSRCLTSDVAYNEAKDIEFFKDRPETWFTVDPGRFAIFFPEDGHAPMAGIGEVHKVVVKIAI